MRYEIKLAGYGGQGIMLSGYIIGKAAAVYGNLYATLTQDYGPEARGGAASSEVVISDGQVDYPYAMEPDVFIAMSQAGYDKYIGKVKEDGLVIIEADLVTPKVTRGNIHGFPATKLVEEKFGLRIIANIAMLGYFAKFARYLKPDMLVEAIKTSVPKKFIDVNLQAFDFGYNYKG